MDESVHLGSVYADLQFRTAGMRRGVKTAQSQMANLQSRMRAVSGSMKNTGRTMTRGLTLPIVGGAAAAVKSFADFEEAMVEVQKVTDQTTADKLSNSIKDMSEVIPLGRTELAGLAADAARFGVKGVDNIESFTEATAKMSIATDLSASEAGESFARLATLTNTPIPKIENLGSAINLLSNNAATSSKEIVDSMVRASATLTNMGLKNTEIVALSGSLNEVSESSERAGTRLRRFGQEMMEPKKVKKMAEALGITVEEFENMRANAPIKLIRSMAVEFKNNTDTADELRGTLSTVSRQTLSGLSKNLDGLDNALEMTATEFKENTSLTKEFEDAQGTMKNQLKLTMNSLANAGDLIAKELRPALKSLRETVENVAVWFKNLSPEMQKNIMMIAGIIAVAGPLIWILGSLVGAISTLIGVIGAISAPVLIVVGAIAAMVAITFKLRDMFSSLPEPIENVANKLLALTNPISGIIEGISMIREQLSDAIPEVDLFGDKVSESTEEAVGSFMKLNNEAMASLKELHWGGREVTQKMADDITGNFEDMRSQVVQALNDQEKETVSSFRQMFAKAKSISDKEQVSILQSVREGYQQRRDEVNKWAKKKSQIIQGAANENRRLTTREFNQIQTLNIKMKDSAIETLTESQREQKAIYENLRRQSGEISARQAAEVVRNSKKQKDQTVAEAREEHKKRVREILMLRDEAGVISDQQADKLIRESERQKKGTVSNAQEQHKKTVDEAKKQAKGNVKQVNWQTGEVLSKWQVHWKEIRVGMEVFRKAIENTIKEKLRNIKAGYHIFMAAIKNQFREWWAEIKLGFRIFKQAVVNTFSDLWNKIKMHVNHFKLMTRIRFNQIKDNMTDAIRDGVSEVVGMFKSLPGDALKWVSGLPGKLYSEMRKAGDAAKRGTEDGMDAHSPTAIERMFFQMRDNVIKSVEDTKKQVGRVSRMSKQFNRVQPQASAATLARNNRIGGIEGGTFNQGSTNLYGNVIIGNDVDEERFFERLNRGQSLRDRGMV